jgi:hypothetical protein
MAYSVDIEAFPATIAAGQSLSGAVPLGAFTLVGIWMPPVWTAAGLTFQVSPDGGTTWLEYYDDGGDPIEITVGESQFVALVNVPNNVWRGVNLFKVRSGTSGSPVDQVAEAIVNLIGRPEVM